MARRDTKELGVLASEILRRLLDFSNRVSRQMERGGLCGWCVRVAAGEAAPCVLKGMAEYPLQPISPKIPAPEFASPDSKMRGVLFEGLAMVATQCPHVLGLCSGIGAPGGQDQHCQGALLLSDQTNRFLPVR